MSTTAQEVKARKSQINPKYSTRAFHRCLICGRSRGYFRMFKMCRLCLRKEAQKGHIPGLVKYSW